MKFSILCDLNFQNKPESMTFDEVWENHAKKNRIVEEHDRGEERNMGIVSARDGQHVFMDSKQNHGYQDQGPCRKKLYVICDMWYVARSDKIFNLYSYLLAVDCRLIEKLS